MNSSPLEPAGPRPFVGLHLKCCNVYVRAYRNAVGDAFTAWCPRCSAPVRVNITQDGTGTSNRFFEAS